MGRKDRGPRARGYGFDDGASGAMGADSNQGLKAIREAESYPGPSLIIAYSPCINHGINMSKSQEEAKLAVETGYWNCYRYDPRRAEEGKNPFQLDSKPATKPYSDFLMNETRYASLTKLFPADAEVLLKEAAEQALEKRAELEKLAAAE